MNAPRVGLLPLYLALYDRALPRLATAQEPFLLQVTDALRAVGGVVATAPICRTRADCAAVLDRFNAADVEVLVILHLAYSPSLEAAELLAASPLPIVLLGTTPDATFGREVDPHRLLYNHGLHGMQDLASVLRRLGKPFRVIAGHRTAPSLPIRCRAVIDAARAARTLRGLRVLRIGGEFPGMGDFAAGDATLLAGLGVRVENCEPADLAAAIAGVPDAEVATEDASDRRHFRVECAPAVLSRSNRVGLGLRAHLAAGGFAAFSLNFLAFRTADGPVNTVPFLECGKAMARGIGYAGEGDVLTAALVAALARAFGPVTFSEMFCPDWEGQSVFLSHMGEVNPAISDRPALIHEKDYPFSPARNPAAFACAPHPGPGTWVNLAPGPAGSFRLLSCPVEILGDGTHPDMDRWVRAWIRPPLPIATFLERFSHAGGTHHSALLLGNHAAAMADFAAFLGVEHCALDSASP